MKKTNGQGCRKANGMHQCGGLDDTIGGKGFCTNIIPLEKTLCMDCDPHGLGSPHGAHHGQARKELYYYPKTKVIDIKPFSGDTPNYPKRDNAITWVAYNTGFSCSQVRTLIDQKGNTANRTKIIKQVVKYYRKRLPLRQRGNIAFTVRSTGLSEFTVRRYWEEAA